MDVSDPLQRQISFPVTPVMVSLLSALSFKGRQTPCTQWQSLLIISSSDCQKYKQNQFLFVCLFEKDQGPFPCNLLCLLLSMEHENPPSVFLAEFVADVT